MSLRSRSVLLVALAAAAFVMSARDATAQARPVAVAATGATVDDLRIWDQQVDQMIRSRDLRVRETQGDPIVASREHQRLDQYYRGVRVFGADLTRQLAPNGTVSIFGLIHSGIDLDATPKLSIDDAPQALAAAIGGQASNTSPELVVLPLSDGYHLAYVGQVTTDVERLNVFVDANTGALLRKYSDFLRDVGTGFGTYGDPKKLSTTAASGSYVADDHLRPAEITTYDMRGSFARTSALLVHNQLPGLSDIASSSVNNWTDGAVVDAHVYAGWYYDYLYKRFGRHGLDGRDLRMALFTHPVQLADIGSASEDVIGTYYINDIYCDSCGPNGRGAVLIGEGAPKGFAGPNLEIKPLSSSLEAVAHELTHGVTAKTARLNGFPFSEAGALNEAFSDIFGISTAFFYEQPGPGVLQASYLLGKSLTIPGGAFVPYLGIFLARALDNPSQTNNPDHYSRRFIGSEPHYTSTIMSHAFYLAVEGGTNRTSGLPVQGVGAANRDQIEKAFFRALTVLLPSSATFALTRDATIQAARDLYGTNSSAERAITQAWNAVGVQDRTVPTAAAVSIPTTAAICSGAQPSWELGVTVSAGTANLLINQATFTFFDASGRTLGSDLLTSNAFAHDFNWCGPGSSRVQAENDACAAYCLDLGGRTGGGVQISFTATDGAGGTQAFSTGRVPLLSQ